MNPSATVIPLRMIHFELGLPGMQEEHIRVYA